MDKIVVSTFYLRIIDIQTEKVLLAIILEYDKGESITNVVDVTSEILRNEVK